MAKIYVSSTFIDLEECRRQVIHLLRRMRHDVQAMEDYTAEDQWPADKCLADADQAIDFGGSFDFPADFFVLSVAIFRNQHV